MNRNALVSGLVMGIAVVAMVALGVMNRPSAPTASAGAPTKGEVRPELVVNDDSHRLSEAPAGSPVFVEFLDFECEACRAAYPLVEKLRADYAGRVEFVIRYFPVDGHANAMNAALAVEAAARQDKLEAMYSKMYETQSQWGEQQESRAPLFREFADGLGLDLDRYDADVASAAVTSRVERDRQEGIELGVQGKPTFFLDGVTIQPSSEGDLRAMFDKAIAK